MDTKQVKENNQIISKWHFSKAHWFLGILVFLILSLIVLVRILNSSSSLLPQATSLNFICPEDYKSQQTQQDDTRKLIVEYTHNFPNATTVDFLSYRYALLVKNNCLKTLNYIKSQANGGDPPTSYIKNTINAANQ